MFKAFSSKVVLTAGLLLAGASFAGSDHSHGKGPHGGIVQGFGNDYHIEGVRSGGSVSIYVLDGEGEKVTPVAKNGGGSITVIAPGKPQQKTEIKAGGTFSESSVTIPDKGKVTVLVNLKIGGKPATAKFNFK